MYFHQLELKGDLADNFSQKINWKIEERTNKNLICLLPDIPFTVPRGKYQGKLYLDWLELHGSSFNYVLKYDNI